MFITEHQLLTSFNLNLTPLGVPTQRDGGRAAAGDDPLCRQAHRHQQGALPGHTSPQVY